MYSRVSDFPIYITQYMLLSWLGSRRHNVTSMGQTEVLLINSTDIFASSYYIVIDKTLLLNEIVHVFRVKAAGHIFSWCKLARCPSKDLYYYKFVGDIVLFGQLSS